ncbi:MAG TPA: hypothetical protein VFP37_14400 [Steroidobacteraceae bacterium]|nr:hypothetical protein [Steroidobacteraceae bacterium]
MSSPRRVKVLAPETAAYIAGLVDGEGTVTLTRLHANERRRLVVCIANTELALLQFVFAAVGVGKITRKRACAPQHTPSFCYAITSRQALALLAQVLPYMRSYKRRRAHLALDSYQRLTPRNGKYDAITLAARQRFEQELLAAKAKAPAPDPLNRSATSRGTRRC